MLEIREIIAEIEGKRILDRLSLSVRPGEIHAIMGPNGAGKSTLAKVLAGDSSYEVLGGELLFCGEEIAELDPEERAHRGLFIGFQYPLEIKGISNRQFLHAALNAHKKARGEVPLSAEVFDALVLEKAALLQIDTSFLDRSLNEGFSGGEKKRNEILQMAILEPKLAILDETDSGLDIDALRVVAGGVNALMNEERALVLITHYQRLLDYIRPDFVHVMIDGKIVRTGGPELAHELEERGYAEEVR